MCDFAGERCLPVFIHLYSTDEARRLAELATSFPATTFIVAHLIGLELLEGLPRDANNVFFDISPPQLVSQRRVLKAIERFRAARVVMGSDTPYGRDNMARNIARLEAGTEVEVAAYGAKSVALEEKTGKVYSQVVKGSKYSVTHNTVTVAAVGTDFDVEAQGKGLIAPVFAGQVTVSWPHGRRVKVKAGFEAIVTAKDGGFEVRVVPIDLGTLDFSWLAFNRDMDKKEGQAPAALNPLPATPPEGTTPPATPGKTTPTTPTPATQPTTPTPQPQGQTTVSLSLASVGPPVSIAWSATNYAGADGAAVLRTDGGAPSYPANAIANVSPGGNGSYSDTAVRRGASYAYAVAYLSGGHVMAVSNTGI